MTRASHYAFVACPCDSQPDFPAASAHARRSSVFPIIQDDDDDDEDEDKTMDPQDPRSNYSLYPYGQLLYCDECHQIRCPRCWVEENTHWFCPSCLFETPSSLVKSDGNRCTRNCFSCPLCTAPLSVNALDQQSREGAGESSGPSGPFFLACPYCEWSSLDAGIEFSKPNKLYEQLQRMRRPKKTLGADGVNEDDARGGTLASRAADESQFHLEDNRYARLLEFYKTQLVESDAASNHPFGFDASYSSPSNLTRIMQIYGGLSAASLKKAKEKPQPMREALNATEGLSLAAADDDDLVAQIRNNPEMIATEAHRNTHPWNYSATKVSALWPVPTLLVTRRSKRCRTCRHILIRHDERKPATGSTHGGSSGSSSIATSLKYKIRLLAQSFIPILSLRPFTPSLPATTTFPNPAFALTASPSTSPTILRPGVKTDLLLLVRNPLFETVRISLATPAITPGKLASRITILCPSFEVGADGDVWDAALSESSSGGRTAGGAGSKAGRRDGGVGKKELLGGNGMQGLRDKDDGEGERVPEAGKVWERGRNWVGVVVEVVVPPPPGSLAAGHGGEGEDEDEDDYDLFLERERKGPRRERSSNDAATAALRLEIPVFVRAEWDAEDVAAEREGVGTKAPKDRREVAFWCVLGAGQVMV